MTSFIHLTLIFTFTKLSTNLKTILQMKTAHDLMMIKIWQKKLNKKSAK